MQEEPQIIFRITLFDSITHSSCWSPSYHIEAKYLYFALTVSVLSMLKVCSLDGVFVLLIVSKWKKWRWRRSCYSPSQFQHLCGERWASELTLANYHKCDSVTELPPCSQSSGWWRWWWGGNSPWTVFLKTAKYYILITCTQNILPLKDYYY